MMMLLRVLLLFVLLISGIESKAQAVFKVINSRVDVGEVPYDSLYAQGAIIYTNLGDAPLYLTKVITFCPCTKAEIPTEPLAPGDTAQIIITHRLKDTGRFKEAAKISYFDPENEDAAKYVFLSGTAVKKDDL